MADLRTTSDDPTGRPRGRGPAPWTGGFTLIEVLISTAVIAFVAVVGVTYVAQGVQQADGTKDRLFAYQKAVSILNELRGYVEGAEGEVASDVDRFDDGVGQTATLSIATVPEDPDRSVPPDHPVSGNTADSGVWKWWRQIAVRPVGVAEPRDRRYCTVRIFRRRPSEEAPGTLLAQASGVVQSISNAYPAVQVYDLYVLAINNAPGWWAEPDSLVTYMEGALAEMKSLLPGSEFRVHYIRKSGYGRDEEYAPYANEVRTTLDPTEWAYWYPGRIPDDDVLEREDERYYAPLSMKGRLNVDGAQTPIFTNDYALPEPFTDTNGNKICDSNEDYTDSNGNDVWDQNNAVPYAMADQHNHAMRWPLEKARFDARVAAGLENPEEPTWRLLLDDMVANPSKYKNAIFLNMHGELLPAPPVRNYSDAAKDPELKPSWRVVAHPERLRFARVPGNDLLSDVPRWRVYAYKTEFVDTEELMTLPEPYVDADNDGAWDAGEAFTDWNANGRYDAGTPMTIVIPGGDFSQNPNGATSPSIVLKRLAGGIKAKGLGAVDDYVDWTSSLVLPERFTDTNSNGIREVTEKYLDLNGNGARNADDPWQEVDGNGVFTATTEPLQDTDADGVLDRDRPAEAFTDANGNSKWDPAEPYWDRDGNGVWTPPTTPGASWKAWDPADYGDSGKTDAYVKNYGEPWWDLDADRSWDAAEAFVDGNGNGVFDAGYRRGDMWARVAYDAPNQRTVVTLYGTPLLAGYVSSSKRGLKEDWRLYDLDYVPCPMPDSLVDTNPFTRSLYYASDKAPKNTARWTIELPLASVRRAFQTAPGANDGDATDRILTTETRIGTDLTTGAKWPVWNKPQNRSMAYAYFYASKDSVPFSERYQFQGDPRHGPYADLTRLGTSFPNGYNAFFDSLKSDGDVRAQFLAFDENRLYQRWMDRCALDVPRYMQWLRTAMMSAEATWASMTGFGCYYLSVGGDVGYDSENTTFAVPCNGIPFGSNDVIEENTFLDVGGMSLSGCIKFVRSNSGDTKGIRDGGYWWSKPWLGELFQDAAYAAQWKPWGNLRAAVGTAPLTYKYIKRESVTKEQQPKGTVMKDSRGTLAREGATAFFLCGVKDKTFHHKEAATNGLLSGQGYPLGTEYGVTLPVQWIIKHPFGIAWSGDGEEPPEFLWTTDFPHTFATYGHDYVAKSPGAAEKGCALIRVADATGTKLMRVLATSVSPETEGGPAFIMRLQLLTLLHSFMLEGVPATPRRLVQLPRPAIREPAVHTKLNRPVSVDVRWNTKWQRWDGKKYAAEYPDGFTESDADLVYVLFYSPDNGESWWNILDGSTATPGTLPLKNGVPDPAKTRRDLNAGAEETLTMAVPPDAFPEGSYLLRLDVFRASQPLHYAYHQAKIYVER